MAKKTTNKKAAAKSKAPVAAKTTAKAAAASTEAGFAGKPRGHFAHPAGIKEGDKVELKVRRGDKMVKTTGTFKYANRNSVEYGVILVGKTLVERSLKQFTKAGASANTAKGNAQRAAH